MSDAEFDFESESETLLAVIDTLSEKPKAMGPKYRHKKCWEVNCVRESKGGLLGLCNGHYTKRSKDDPEQYPPKQMRKKCTEYKCPNMAQGGVGGLCFSCSTKQNNGVPVKKRVRKKCSKEPCKKVAQRDGMCNSHFKDAARVTTNPPEHNSSDPIGMVCVPIGNDGGSTGNTSQDLDMGGMGPFTLETYNAIEESLLADIGFGFDENEMISQISKSSFL